MKSTHARRSKAPTTVVSTESIVVDEVSIPASDVKSSQYLIDCFLPEKTTKAFKDISGQTFGKVTAIKYIGIQKTFHIFLFRCACGKLFLNPSFNVTSGRTKSCGDAKHKPLRNNLTGQKIKMWTVLEHIPTEKNAIVYRCRCECGTIKNVFYSALLSNEHFSCGCFAKKRQSKSFNRISSEPLKKLVNRLRIVTQLNYSGKYSETNTIVRGLTFTEYVTYMKSKFSENMNIEKWSNGEIHIDHIIPISYAKTCEDAVYLSHYTNMLPMWSSENQSKWNKLPDNFDEEAFSNYKKSVDLDRESKGYLSVQDVITLWDISSEKS